MSDAARGGQAFFELEAQTVSFNVELSTSVFRLQYLKMERDMGLRLSKIFTVGGVVLLAAAAFAHDHHALNGTWTLVPSESNFAGGQAIQNGTLTINDREGNIYVSRNFGFEDNDHRMISYEFSTDGKVNSTIRDGKEFRTKARWEGDVLRVATFRGGLTTVERFRLRPDGSLMLVVARQGMEPLTLMFHRIA
jgi:hypothetical protein